MTDNFIALTLIAVFFYVFISDGFIVKAALVAFFTLALLSGYGVLPVWQG